MKRFISIIFTFSVLLVAHSQSTLQQFVQSSALKHASVGVCVKDLSTGKTVVSHNDDKSLTTASIMKLITSATALELLGPDYRYETQLALDAQDPSKLLIVGSGDPTLGTAVYKEDQHQFLKNWTNKLQTQLKGVNRLKLYVVDNYFGYAGVSDEWTWIDMGNYYAAGAYGISVFDNTYKLFFNTTDRSSSPKIIRTEPEIRGLTFDNYLQLNSTGRDNGYIYGAPFSYERILRGNIPAGRSSFSIKGDIPDPGLLLGEKLAKELERKAIHVSAVETSQLDYIANINRTPRERAQTYQVGKVLYRQKSRPLNELLRQVNVKSNNHYAEHIIRTVGREQNSDIYSDALKEGIKFTNKYWKQKNASASSFFIHDGSGLAPQNAASPEAFCDILLYMHNKSAHAKEFYYTLPIAGIDGTLKYFMNNTKYRGKIRAKSGSISGVQCYAGYIIDGDKKLAFSVMVNKFTEPRSAVRRAIEQFIVGL